MSPGWKAKDSDEDLSTTSTGIPSASTGKRNREARENMIVVLSGRLGEDSDVDTTDCLLERVEKRGDEDLSQGKQCLYSFQRSSNF